MTSKVRLGRVLLRRNLIRIVEATELLRRSRSAHGREKKKALSQRLYGWLRTLFFSCSNSACVSVPLSRSFLRLLNFVNLTSSA